MLQLDAIQTLALAGLALFLGYALCRFVPVFARYNLPPPVIGGLVVALAVLVARQRDVVLFELDTSLQSPLMIAFFTTIGINASLALLKVSGRQVMVFLALASAFAVAQNLLGMAVAAAMAGIVLGGLVGGPAITVLIRRHGLRGRSGPEWVVEQVDARSPLDDASREFRALQAIVLLLLAMWLGHWVSKGIAALGLTLPAYIGAMLVGAAFRNLDDATGWLRLPVATLDLIGNVCLALFLSLALMNLKLWELSGLALPLLVNLALQVLMVVLFCGVVFRAMGRDYDAAVMGGGFIGFMLGTTANAMAVMRTLTERYGAAPRAFLVAPLVGAFFIDFTNALIITGFINLWD